MTTFYLTTPIYYVNARPHLGHAYTTIIADAMARYRRLVGDDVFFLTGTDEHGEKIAQAAAQAGVSPQAYTDEIAAVFQTTWKELDIEYDKFIRTTEREHKTVVQRILGDLWAKSLKQKRGEEEIYLGKYGGQYCVGCERFYTEKEIVDGKCPDHQTPLQYIEEENYFFRMSKYQDWLIGYIKEHPDLIRPERYRNEILGFLREPLQDLSISRPRTRLEWGIPLPFDDRFVTYVWFDALINYVSAIGYPDAPGFAERWASVQHLIGKDILKPHAIYWPCMLKAAGLPVFTHLDVHGYWGLGGGKMSKSIGNVVEALALTKTYGNDAFRYFVMREMAFGLDADFSEEAFIGRLNADLANDLGNLVARATTVMAAHGGGISIAWGSPKLEITAREEELQSAFMRTRQAVDAAMAEFGFHRALAAIWEFIARVNQYVDGTAPWALAKRNDERARRQLETVLTVLGESLRSLGIILAPFLPEAATRLRSALGDSRDPNQLGIEEAALGKSIYPVAVTPQKLSGLFPRVDVKAVAVPVESAGSPGRDASAPRISIDEFAKLELRVAEVRAAEAVPKSKKLLKLTLSLGAEERTVVAGIAEHYAPVDLVGKKVVIVANLAPAKLMGIESNGMVLAGSADGRLAVLGLDRDLPPGARVQ